MAEEKQQCDAWQEARKDFIIKIGGVYFGRKGKFSIDYCPFCGSPLDDQGCTRELRADYKDIEVPF